MKKNMLFSTLGVLALGAIVVTTAYAYQGNVLKKGPNHTDARESAISQAVTSGNYEAWKNLMVPGCRAATVVTKDNFPRFAEMWKLEHSGNAVEANKIRSELGLGQGMRNGTGLHNGQGGGVGMHRNQD